MREKRFIAEHRGGPLTMEHHRALMRWAIVCVEHVWSLAKKPIDPRLITAIEIARDWANEKAPTGAAMKASVAAHAAAREATDAVSKSVARSVGQAVATAHMADHSVGAALYAQQAANRAGLSFEKERDWQCEQLQSLSSDLVELVLMTMKNKPLKM